MKQVDSVSFFLALGRYGNSAKSFWRRSELGLAAGFLPIGPKTLLTHFDSSASPSSVFFFERLLFSFLMLSLAISTKIDGS